MWIADCASRGWTIISGDKGIEYDGVNRRAVIDAKAKVFILADTTSRTIEWASALVIARHKILRIAAENNGPFYCDIEKAKDDHVGKPRFQDGGGPIPKAASMSEAESAVPSDPTVSPALENDVPKSGDLPFDEEPE